MVGEQEITAKQRHRASAPALPRALPERITKQPLAEAPSTQAGTKAEIKTGELEARTPTARAPEGWKEFRERAREQAEKNPELKSDEKGIERAIDYAEFIAHAKGNETAFEMLERADLNTLMNNARTAHNDTGEGGTLTDAIERMHRQRELRMSEGEFEARALEAAGNNPDLKGDEKKMKWAIGYAKLIAEWKGNSRALRMLETLPLSSLGKLATKAHKKTGGVGSSLEEVAKQLDKKSAFKTQAIEAAAQNQNLKDYQDRPGVLTKLASAIASTCGEEQALEVMKTATYDEIVGMLRRAREAKRKAAVKAGNSAGLECATETPAKLSGEFEAKAREAAGENQDLKTGIRIKKALAHARTIAEFKGEEEALEVLREKNLQVIAAIANALERGKRKQEKQATQQQRSKEFEANALEDLSARPRRSGNFKAAALYAVSRNIRLQGDEIKASRAIECAREIAEHRGEEEALRMLQGYKLEELEAAVKRIREISEDVEKLKREAREKPVQRATETPAKLSGEFEAKAHEAAGENRKLTTPKRIGKAIAHARTIAEFKGEKEALEILREKNLQVIAAIANGLERGKRKQEKQAIQQQRSKEFEANALEAAKKNPELTTLEKIGQAIAHARVIAECRGEAKALEDLRERRLQAIAVTAGGLRREKRKLLQLAQQPRSKDFEARAREAAARNPNLQANTCNYTSEQVIERALLYAEVIADAYGEARALEKLEGAAFNKIANFGTMAHKKLGREGVLKEEIEAKIREREPKMSEREFKAKALEAARNNLDLKGDKKRIEQALECAKTIAGHKGKAFALKMLENGTLRGISVSATSGRKTLKKADEATQESGEDAKLKKILALKSMFREADYAEAIALVRKLVEWLGSEEDAVEILRASDSLAEFKQAASKELRRREKSGWAGGEFTGSSNAWYHRIAPVVDCLAREKFGECDELPEVKAALVAAFNTASGDMGVFNRVLDAVDAARGPNSLALMLNELSRGNGDENEEEDRGEGKGRNQAGEAKVRDWDPDESRFLLEVLQLGKEEAVELAVGKKSAKEKAARAFNIIRKSAEGDARALEYVAILERLYGAKGNRATRMQIAKELREEGQRTRDARKARIRLSQTNILIANSLHYLKDYALIEGWGNMREGRKLVSNRIQSTESAQKIIGKLVEEQRKSARQKGGRAIQFADTSTTRPPSTRIQKLTARERLRERQERMSSAEFAAADRAIAKRQAPARSSVVVRRRAGDSTRLQEDGFEERARKIISRKGYVGERVSEVLGIIGRIAGNAGKEKALEVLEDAGNLNSLVARLARLEARTAARKPAGELAGDVIAQLQKERREETTASARRATLERTATLARPPEQPSAERETTAVPPSALPAGRMQEGDFEEEAKEIIAGKNCRGDRAVKMLILAGRVAGIAGRERALEVLERAVDTRSLRIALGKLKNKREQAGTAARKPAGELVGDVISQLPAREQEMTASTRRATLELTATLQQAEARTTIARAETTQPQRAEAKQTVRQSAREIADAAFASLPSATQTERQMSIEEFGAKAREAAERNPKLQGGTRRLTHAQRVERALLYAETIAKAYGQQQALETLGGSKFRGIAMFRGNACKKLGMKGSLNEEIEAKTREREVKMSKQEFEEKAREAAAKNPNLQKGTHRHTHARRVECALLYAETIAKARGQTSALEMLEHASFKRIAISGVHAHAKLGRKGSLKKEIEAKVREIEAKTRERETQMNKGEFEEKAREAAARNPKLQTRTRRLTHAQVVEHALLYAEVVVDYYGQAKAIEMLGHASFKGIAITGVHAHKELGRKGSLKKEIEAKLKERELAMPKAEFEARAREAAEKNPKLQTRTRRLISTQMVESALLYAETIAEARGQTSALEMLESLAFKEIATVGMHAHTTLGREGSLKEEIEAKTRGREPKISGKEFEAKAREEIETGANEQARTTPGGQEEAEATARGTVRRMADAVFESLPQTTTATPLAQQGQGETLKPARTGTLEEQAKACIARKGYDGERALEMLGVTREIMGVVGKMEALAMLDRASNVRGLQNMLKTARSRARREQAGGIEQVASRTLQVEGAMGLRESAPEAGQVSEREDVDAAASKTGGKAVEAERAREANGAVAASEDFSLSGMLEVLKMNGQAGDERMKAILERIRDGTGALEFARQSKKRECKALELRFGLKGEGGIENACDALSEKGERVTPRELEALVEAGLNELRNALVFDALTCDGSVAGNLERRREAVQLAKATGALKKLKREDGLAFEVLSRRYLNGEEIPSCAQVADQLYAANLSKRLLGADYVRVIEKRGVDAILNDVMQQS